MSSRIQIFGMRTAAALLLYFLSGASLFGGIQIQLTPSPGGPQPVGTVLTWTATVTDTDPGPHDYQFSTALLGFPQQIRRDFSPLNYFTWAPSKVEGTYMVRVIVRNTSAHTSAQVTQQHIVTSRLNNGYASVHHTAHPLVALFSGPACYPGNRMWVRFHQLGGTTSQTTNAIACHPPTSMNFLIAGMYPDTIYIMRWETLNPQGGIVNVGSDFVFITGKIPPNIQFPPITVLTGPVPNATEPILLHNYIPVGASWPLTATDLTGRPLWYYDGPVSIFGRSEWGGNMLLIANTSANPALNYLREIDLAGNIVTETNVARINELLVAAHYQPITGLHHEARRLANGDIVMLGAVERLETNTGQGAGTVDVLGDAVIVLDSHLQLKWYWNAFDHLDVNRAALLGEVCSGVSAGCPPHNLAANANDWLHSNSVQQTSDGNLIISLRHQDWVIKVDYRNGAGTGAILWRLGNQGDFRLLNPGNDPFPWFSHQHDPEFEFGTNNLLSVFDNGNTRQVQVDPNAHSRGQVYSINEATREAHLNFSGDLGVYSPALGSAEILSNGNRHFNAGFVGGFGGISHAVELDPSGRIVYTLQSGTAQTNAVTYRSFRMRDLYTPVTP